MSIKILLCDVIFRGKAFLQYWVALSACDDNECRCNLPSEILSDSLHMAPHNSCKCSTPSQLLITSWHLCFEINEFVKVHECVDTYGVSKRSFQSIKYNIYFINLDWHWMFRNTFNYEINESKHFCKLTLNTKCNFGEC